MLQIRQELLHPLFAHFPISLFTLALLVKLTELIFIKRENFARNCGIIFNFLIIIAPIFFLITMFLGDSALDTIKNNFCDLASADRHEEMAEVTLYFMLGAMLFTGLSNIEKIKNKFFLPCQVAIVIFLLIGNFYLAQTAHLGAMLVYEKGAAVKNYPTKCQ